MDIERQINLIDIFSGTPLKEKIDDKIARSGGSKDTQDGRVMSNFKNF